MDHYQIDSKNTVGINNTSAVNVRSNVVEGTQSTPDDWICATCGAKSKKISVLSTGSFTEASIIRDTSNEHLKSDIDNPTTEALAFPTAEGGTMATVEPKDIRAEYKVRTLYSIYLFCYFNHMITYICT